MPEVGRGVAADEMDTVYRCLKENGGRVSGHTYVCSILGYVVGRAEEVGRDFICSLVDQDEG
eukprot:1703467-Amphidinium_carterae.5